MGITDFSLSLLEGIIAEHKPRSVIELGAQNLYTNGPAYGKYADTFYREHKILYECIDLNGENYAEPYDLSLPIHGVVGPHLPPEVLAEMVQGRQYDLVTDFGTSEHVQGFYQCWLNKWRLCKVGGVIVSENPKTGNWPGHGYNYVTMEFYAGLSKALGNYATMERGEHPAMGNTTDGWNVWCIMVKNSEDFITEKEFNKLAWHPK